MSCHRIHPDLELILCLLAHSFYLCNEFLGVLTTEKEWQMDHYPGDGICGWVAVILTLIFVSRNFHLQNQFKKMFPQEPNRNKPNNTSGEQHQVKKALDPSCPTLHQQIMNYSKTKIVPAKFNQNCP